MKIGWRCVGFRGALPPRISQVPGSHFHCLEPFSLKSELRLVLHSNSPSVTANKNWKEPFKWEADINGVQQTRRTRKAARFPGCVNRGKFGGSFLFDFVTKISNGFCQQDEIILISIEYSVVVFFIGSGRQNPDPMRTLD